MHRREKLRKVICSHFPEDLESLAKKCGASAASQYVGATNFPRLKSQ